MTDLFCMILKTNWLVDGVDVMWDGWIIWNYPCYIGIKRKYRFSRSINLAVKRILRKVQYRAMLELTYNLTS